MKAAVVVATVVAVAAGGAGVTLAGGGGSPGGASTTTVATDTATVQRKTLTEQDDVDGTLGYGASSSITNRAQGTVTKLPELGAVVQRNGILYELDGKPVRLFYGDTPAFRRLADGVSEGADVKQLEQNLKDLGFANGLITTPNAKWDSVTTAAVKRWEKSVGLDQDGVIEDGEIVFSTGAVRIASRKVDMGASAQPGSPVLTVTGTTRLIDVDLDARKQRLATQGAKVEVELPDGTTTTGTITKVGTVATQPSSGNDDGGPGGGDDEEPTIDVTVVLDDANVGGSLDGAPVTVKFTSQSREGVLAVPVAALLALSEGGYAVELADSRKLVKVETGLFSQGLVEVKGEGLAEGAKVVIPK